MKKLVEEVLEDLSTREVFLFRVVCGICEADCAGKQSKFSKAGIVPRTQAKQIIYDACYEQEFRDAYHAAVQHAAERLNYCPICKRLVCNRCFLICDDLDMCRQCASMLDETGTPVEQDIFEVAI